MNNLSKIPPDHQLMCFYCKENYQHERELTIHMYIHGNCDLNKYLSRSKPFIKSYSLPRAYPNSPSVPEYRLDENSNVNSSKIINKNGYEHRINKKSTYLRLATLDKKFSDSPYFNPRRCVMAPKSQISLSANEELIQLRKNFTENYFVPLRNSERISQSKTEYLQQNSRKRTMSDDPSTSPDSGVFEENDYSPEDNNSEECSFESSTKSGKMTPSIDFKIQRLENSSVNHQKLLDSPDCYKPGSFENDSYLYNPSPQNLPKHDFISDPILSSEEYRVSNVCNSESSRFELAANVFPASQCEISE